MLQFSLGWLHKCWKIQLYSIAIDHRAALIEQHPIIALHWTRDYQKAFGIEVVASGHQFQIRVGIIRDLLQL